MRAQTIWRTALHGMLVTSIAVGACGYVAGNTHAMTLAASGSGVRVGSLSTFSSLQVESSSINLGVMAAGAMVEQPGAVRVRNISNRTLTLSAFVEGAPGLSAQLSAQTLAPGEVAEISVAGSTSKAGRLAGRLVVQAFGGFLSTSVPLSGMVNEPPKPDCATGAPAPLPAPPAEELMEIPLAPPLPPAEELMDSLKAAEEQAKGSCEADLEKPEAPAEPEQVPAPEEKPAEPEQVPAPEEQPVEPEQAPAPEEQPAEPEQVPAPEEQPSESESAPAPEEQPVEPEQAPAPEEPPPEPTSQPDSAPITTGGES